MKVINFEDTTTIVIPSVKKTLTKYVNLLIAILFLCFGALILTGIQSGGYIPKLLGLLVILYYFYLYM